MTSAHMQRALELARNASECTAPNPTVGAVVVANGETIAEGVTLPPPGPHAEAVALEKAGERARGATMFVTLEPCAHQGRTPPCTGAIIDAGVAEVHYAVADPDPNVDGAGHEALEAAGIRTVAGEEEAEARRFYEAYIKHRTTGLPFVVAKFASSLDGRISSASGDSRWISGEEARRWAHELRTRIDGILVGSSTIVVDDAQLTARPDDVETARQPLRIIVDTRGRTPPMARVFTVPGKTIVATSERAPGTWLGAIRATGAEVLLLPEFQERVDIQLLLEELGHRGIVTLLVEGGGMILGNFFDRGLVDKVHAIIAPIIVGAQDAHTAIAGKGAYRMADALHMRDITIERLGEDILITGYPIYEAPPA
jgi:diaminohydroxyphosphoribosylaminopyrimidine deaminase/5-amino-6-(5-phosphoribosylamino)uracil reductase